MRAVKTISVGDLSVDIKELSLGDIRAWLKDLESAQDDDVVGVTLFEDFTLDDLTRMTSLAPADMDILTPAEIRQVMDVAREVNGDFFGMRGRLLALGQAALENSVTT